MFEAIESDFLVPFDGRFSLASAPPRMKVEGPENSGKIYKRKLENIVEDLQDLQRLLYAHDKHAILLIFQAMDAAGKDSTIRAVVSGVNPAGCQVFSFKQPSSKELNHDFLWRTNKNLPERGKIGIFNRSYYEEVLVARVHPRILRRQNLPEKINLDTIWEERFESICDLEKHLARNGTVTLKFWLNVSKQEQKNRFISRIDTKKKNWKWSSADLEERSYWEDYMHAYEQALNATSKSWAPWYAIPADDKPFMRYSVARILKKTLQNLNLKYPTLSKKERERLIQAREQLLSDRD